MTLFKWFEGEKKIFHWENKILYNVPRQYLERFSQRIVDIKYFNVIKSIKGNISTICFMVIADDAEKNSYL